MNKDQVKGNVKEIKGNVKEAAGNLLGNDKLKAKVVSIGGKAYPAAHLEVLASLPTRDQALSMFLSTLVEPATRVARAFKAIAEKQEATA